MLLLRSFLFSHFGLPVRCSVLPVLGRSLLLVSISLLEWQRGVKYNTFWKERYIFNGNMRSLSLRVSWETKGLMTVEIEHA